MPWREAARIAARIARALDRQHAQGKPHGGLEPLTVLFVAGNIRLAEPLPPASRDEAFLSARLLSGEPPDRASDFHALGCLLGAMVGAGGLPPPLAAVQRRLLANDQAAGYRSGNDVAAALELAIAASEGLTAPALPPAVVRASPPIEQPGSGAPTAAPPHVVASQLRRMRRPSRLIQLLIGLVVVGVAGVFWLSSDDDVEIVAPDGADELGPIERTVRVTPPPDMKAPGPAPPSEAGDVPLADVLAALPDGPRDELPALPDAKTQLLALVAGLRSEPCTRLELEPSAVSVRLVGSTPTAADRQDMLARIAALDDVDDAVVEVDATSHFCRLFDLLAKLTEPAVPRLFDLMPKRSTYRLTEAEPLVVDALTPGFSSHLSVHYFAADGMVVHLTHQEAEMPRHPPFTDVRIGDPTDGHWLTIAEPYGRELIVALASEELLFTEPRARIEPAADYLDALEEALAAQRRRPIASTMIIETRPADR